MMRKKRKKEGKEREKHRGISDGKNSKEEKETWAM